MQDRAQVFKRKAVDTNFLFLRERTLKATHGNGINHRAIYLPSYLPHRRPQIFWRVELQATHRRTHFVTLVLTFCVTVSILAW